MMSFVIFEMKVKRSPAEKEDSESGSMYAYTAAES